MKGKTYYMHTIGGKPAQFVKQQGTICFANHFGPANELAESLRQIRREQKISALSDRDSMNSNYLGRFKYSYVRVCIPEGAR